MPTSGLPACVCPPGLFAVRVLPPPASSLAPRAPQLLRAPSPHPFRLSRKEGASRNRSLDSSVDLSLRVKHGPCSPTLQVPWAHQGPQPGQDGLLKTLH